jgi:hypothetical protein
MRTPADALLSVRRYVLGVLPGPPWRVLLAGDEGRVERPYAVVSTADGTTGSHEGPATVRLSLPIVVHAFPPVGTRPSHSKLIAERVASAFDAAVRVGVRDYAVPTVRGFKQMMPLWDYEGAGGPRTLAQLTSSKAIDDARPAVTRYRPDYLWVADGWKVQSLPQADTGELFVATLEARVQWLAPTGLRPTEPTVAAVTADVTP